MASTLTSLAIGFSRKSCETKRSISITIIASLCWFTVCSMVLAQSRSSMTFEEAKQRADRGDAFAQAVVALHYQLGWNTEKNPELAAKYAAASANAGEPLGQFRLGALMREGVGVPKDEERGLSLQAASFNGLYNAQDPYSMTAAGIMILQGKVVGQDVSQDERRRDAAALYKKAADMGYAPAQFNYAMALNEGHGVAKDAAARGRYLLQAKKERYPLAFRWMPEPNSASGLARHISIDSIKSMATAADDLRSRMAKLVVQEESDDVQSVDVSQAQKRIALLTRDKILLYECPTGRLLLDFAIGEFVSEIYFRQEQQDRLLLVNRYKPSASEINLKTREITPLSLKNYGTPIGYDSTNDELIVFADLTGNWVLGGELTALCLKTGQTRRLGSLNRNPTDKNIKAISKGSGLKAIINSKGELAIVGFYTDLGDGFMPMTLFARNNRGSWELAKDKILALSVQRFLMLPDTFQPHYNNKSGYTSASWDGKDLTITFDKMLWLSARGPVLPLNDSPMTELYVATHEGGASLAINSGSIRRVDGLSASEDGTKVFLWNINEHWLRETFAPSYGHFYFRTQRAAMNCPPMFINSRTFEAVSLPISEKFVWSAAMSDDGTSVSMMVTDKRAKATRLHGLPLAQGGESGQIIKAQKIAMSYPSLDETLLDEQMSVPDPLQNNDGEISVWLGEKVSIDLDDAAFWTARDQSATNSESFITTAKTGQCVRVTNNTAWDGNGEYEFDAILTLADKTGAVIGELHIDNAIQSAFPIDEQKVLAVAGGTLFIYSFTSNRLEGALFTGELDTREKILSVGPASRSLWYREPSGHSLRLVGWDNHGTLSEVLRLFPQLEGPPVYLTSDEFYASTNKGQSGLHFSDEDWTYPFEQFDLRLNRPDIVLERLGAPDEAVAIAKQLREKRLKRMGVTEEMLKPDFHVPELEIVGNVPATTDANEISFAIKANDTKYPLDRLKVFVNNVPVNGREGESLRDQNKQTLERSIPVKLASGRNKIQVSVLNNAGAESLYANAEVNCTARRPKPTLYAVALGVSDYANPDWNLKYAAKDARDVLERLKTRSGGSYNDVKELLLTDKEVTKESLGQIRDFLKDATIDDTVLMFVAGHGLLDSNYDYYFGTTDIDFNNPAEKGIAFDEFDDLLAALPCLKKSLLIDTCHAGELDEEEKTLLASAGGAAAPLPAGNGIAMRSIGTRGMNVKAIEGARGASEWYDRLQGLFVDLRRGSGSTILSSSAGAEYALESSEQQNGLFTYAVLEALDGKKEADTDKDGSIEMSELGEYVKKRVSELTNNKQTPNTRRVNLEGDFTLAKTE